MIDNFDFLQGAAVAIISSSAAAIGSFLKNWGENMALTKRGRKRVLSYLMGLPPEVKPILIYFHYHGTHSLRANTRDTGILFLIERQILSVSTGGWRNGASDRYCCIRPDIWESMNKWINTDTEAVADFISIIDEPSKNRFDEIFHW